ncbi:hypothetical protein SEUCBS139899_003685 [Sporothrix eucalyptigena]
MATDTNTDTKGDEQALTQMSMVTDPNDPSNDGNNDDTVALQQSPSSEKSPDQFNKWFQVQDDMFQKKPISIQREPAQQRKEMSEEAKAKHADMLGLLDHINNTLRNPDGLTPERRRQLAWHQSDEEDARRVRLRLQQRTMDRQSLWPEQVPRVQMPPVQVPPALPPGRSSPEALMLPQAQVAPQFHMEPQMQGPPQALMLPSALMPPYAQTAPYAPQPQPAQGPAQQPWPYPRPARKPQQGTKRGRSSPQSGEKRVRLDSPQAAPFRELLT